MPFASETAYSQGKRDRRRKTVRIDDHSSKFPVRACALMQSRKRWRERVRDRSAKLWKKRKKMMIASGVLFTFLSIILNERLYTWNQVTLTLLVTYAHQHLIRQPIGRKMKDKTSYYSFDVLVLGVCLFELSFFFILSSRSTVFSLLSQRNIYVCLCAAHCSSLTKDYNAIDEHAL